MFGMRKLAIIFVIVVAVLALGAGLLGTVVWGRLHEPYKGYAASEQLIEIPQGSGTNEIGRRLVERGIVRDLFIFRAAMWWSGTDRSLKAGEYRFAEPMSAAQVVDKLARGDVYAHRITFPEGLTILDMSKIYEQRGFGAASQFVGAASDGSAIKDLDPEAPDLEGYLYPETYAIPRGTPASKLIGQMVQRFREAYTEDLKGQAAAQGLTTRQVVTLASLIEKETAREHERGLVAAVYRNRMKLGMGMQADPTVIYALQKAGKYDGNIRRSDLQFDSPYNTYKYPGLPPGPIASPRQESLAAALAPADVPYLYFVSRNDGTHVFASTLAEHNRNVHEYQILYFREKRLREQRERRGAQRSSD
jgi:UPF0755 protein